MYIHTKHLHIHTGRGRAEPIRFALAAANLNFENAIVSEKNDLAKLRKDGRLKYGQLPMLEIDGMELVQSGSILRYVARKGNLYPSPPKDQYLVDVICDGVNDMRSSVIGFPFDASVDTLKEDVQRLVPRYFTPFETHLRESKSDFFLDRVTVADVVLFEVLDFIRCVTSLEWTLDVLKPYPHVTKHFKRTMPGVGSLKKYLESRKQLPWDEYADSVRKTLSGMRGK